MSAQTITVRFHCAIGSASTGNILTPKGTTLKEFLAMNLPNQSPEGFNTAYNTNLTTDYSTVLEDGCRVIITPKKIAGGDKN